MGRDFQEDHFQTRTWPNGFRLIWKPLDRPVTHCGLILDAGSRDDAPGEEGCAHFMEHTLFKGTQKRKAFHVLNRLDSVGGEFNASTSKEDTWIYAAFLQTHLERAMELIADITFHASFPPAEVEKERDVILDEVDSYRDQPVEALFDEFEERLFAGHPLATPVLGTPETVERITRETLVRFRERCYVPEGMVLSVVGSHRWEEVERLADKYFGAAPARKLDRPRQTFEEGARFDVRRPVDSNQVHHLMGRVTVGGDHPDRMGLALLANLLGGPSMNNRLSLRVRERHGLAYNLECSYAPLTDTGVFSIYFGTDVRQHERAESLIFKELQNVCAHKLGVRQLHELKVQMLGHMALAQDSGHALMTGLGKSLLQFGRVEPMEVVFQEIERVTSEDLLRLANEVLPLEGLSHLAYLPGN